MSTLLLRFAAPMQSWGVSSKFNRRMTNGEPSRSGVIGLLAAALGRERHESLAPFQSLKFGVRIDQPGTIQRDFHMAHGKVGSKDTPWRTYRYYVEDAVFLAALEGEAGFLGALENALQNPVFPLFLGRRSCPPTGPLVLGIREKNLRQALQEEPWQASAWYQRKSARQEIRTLDIVRDADFEEVSYAVRDVPQSFDPHRRSYAFRNVIREQILLQDVQKVESPEGREGASIPTEHDPMDLLEEYDVSFKSQD